MAEVIAKSSFRSSKYFLQGCQHACHYRKANQSGEAETVWYVPCVEYDQNKEGIWCAAIAEMQYLNKRPGLKCRMRGIQALTLLDIDMFRLQYKDTQVWFVKSTNCYLHPQSGLVENLETWWRCRSMGTPPPDWSRQLTPQLTATLHGMPPVPSIDNEGSQASQVAGVSSGYVNIHNLNPKVQLSNLDANATDCKDDTDFIPDMMTNERTSTR